ncbi:dolichyl-phosphate beta-D-mannosyltransferase [Actinomyces viscosus]|nr:dolichyl-phosphate beta-D-mannosyltransferase [Actinomyces viscosus]
MVAAAPARAFTARSRAASAVPPLTTSTPYLPTDFSAVRRDMTSWTLWLLLATLIRTLLSTHRILYPRMLLIGITTAVLIQLTAWCVTWRYWPWASTRVMPFIIVAGAGFVAGSCFLDLVAGVHLLPWTASVSGSIIAVADQWRYRLRWRARAQRALEPAS